MLTSFAVCLLGLANFPAPAVAQEPAAPRPTRPPGGVVAGYHNYDALVAALEELAGGSGGSAVLSALAETPERRKVLLLQLAAPGDVPPDYRQAILVVGGMDAERPDSSELVLAVARKLLRDAQDAHDGPAAKLLAARTLYLVPRANPDGVEQAFAPVATDSRLSPRGVDDDRDLATDEDGPDDLDGDGQISVMRVPDPASEWMVDLDEPLLMKRADRARGERGAYRLMLEGRDNDGDGEINEDGVGGVDHDRNWPHLYEAGSPGVGLYQLSEVETRSLADFVVAHPNISAAIVLGRHDNIVRVPKEKDRGPDGQSYKDLHPDDIPLYDHLSERFRKTTALSGSPGARPDGAFYAWLYSQRGIITLASTGWWPLEEGGERPASQPASEPAPGGGDAVSSGGDEPGSERSREAIVARFREQTRPRGEGGRRGEERGGEERPGERGARGGRDQPRAAGPPAGGGRGGFRFFGRGARGATGGDTAAAESKPPGADAVAPRVESSPRGRGWLRYSNEKRGGEGFKAWSDFDHPTLGPVQLGGMRPYFAAAPPAGELSELAARQADFLVELSGLLPAPRWAAPKVTAAGADLWQVELRLINDGYLPTHPAIARHIQQPGWVVRPAAPDRVVGGLPVERAANLEGSGGVAVLRWLVRGREGEKLEFHAYARRYGELKTQVELRATAPGEENK